MTHCTMSRCSTRELHLALLTDRDGLTWVLTSWVIYVPACWQKPCLHLKNVVKRFDHGAIGRRIDPLLWTHCAISRFSQFSMTGVQKAMVCIILSVE